LGGSPSFEAGVNPALGTSFVRPDGFEIAWQKLCGILTAVRVAHMQRMRTDPLMFGVSHGGRLKIFSELRLV